MKIYIGNNYGDNSEQAIKTVRFSESLTISPLESATTESDEFCQGFHLIIEDSGFELDNSVLSLSVRATACLM